MRTTYDINQIDGGIIAAQGQYGKFCTTGEELLLFMPAGDICGSQTPIARTDVRRAVGGLSNYGLKELRTPISTAALTQGMRAINADRNHG